MTAKRHSLLERQLRPMGNLIGRLGAEDFAVLERFLDAVSDAYSTYDNDREFIEHSMELSSTELFSANQEMKQQNRKLAELQAAAEKLRYENELILNSVSEGIVRVNLDGVVTFSNPEAADMAGRKSHELAGRPLHDVLPHASGGGVACDGHDCAVLRSLRGGEVIHVDTNQFIRADGTRFPAELTSAPIRDGGVISGAVMVFKDITKRRQLEKSYMEAAHQAGMAEIATGVLHNIGNILNSVNVGAEAMLEVAKGGRIATFAKANAMLTEITDPRAAKLSGYYASLQEAVSGDYRQLELETRKLLQKIQLIKDVVSIQQDYAKGARFKEPVSPQEAIENALLMQLDSLTRHHVKVVKRYGATGTVLAQKSKLVHILLNLIKNAKEAMDGMDTDRTLSIATESESSGGVLIRISDTGVGVPPENIDRIFTHGFTTKKDGHGFGLHHCANALQEMGGAIYACSDGPGKGTTFTLRFKAAA